MLQTGTSVQEEMVKFQHGGFAHDAMYICILIYDVQLVQKIVTPAIQALVLLPSSRLCELTFSMLVEIKSKLTQNTRTKS